MKPKTIWQVLGEHRGVLLFFYALFAAVIVTLAAIGVYRRLTAPQIVETQVGVDEISGSPIYETNFYYPAEEGQVLMELFGVENISHTLRLSDTTQSISLLIEFWNENYPDVPLRRISIVKNSFTEPTRDDDMFIFTFRAVFNNDRNYEAIVTINAEDVQTSDIAVSWLNR